jgi:hypothetical protein
MYSEGERNTKIGTETLKGPVDVVVSGDSIKTWSDAAEISRRERDRIVSNVVDALRFAELLLPGHQWPVKSAFVAALSRGRRGGMVLRNSPPNGDAFDGSASVGHNGRMPRGGAALVLGLRLLAVIALCTAGCISQYEGPSAERQNCVSACQQQHDRCIVDASGSRQIDRCEQTVRECLQTCPAY